MNPDGEPKKSIFGRVWARIKSPFKRAAGQGERTTKPGESKATPSQPVAPAAKPAAPPGQKPKSLGERAWVRVKAFFMLEKKPAPYIYSAKSFDEVMQDEWWEIRVARALRNGESVDELRKEEIPPGKAGGKKKEAVPENSKQRKLVGLAFSGGGIRSATLNLGMLQGLAKFNLLEKMDYISAVSGGNYIASWLAAWIKREGFATVKEQLSPDRVPPAAQPGAASAAPVAPPALEAEAKPISWLRSYSNYLTPRLGLVSGDTWFAIATYLRNLLLNQTILVLVIGGVLLLPRVLTWLGREIGDSWDTSLIPIPWAGALLSWVPSFVVKLVGKSLGPGHIYFVVAFLLIVKGIWNIHVNMKWFSDSKAGAEGVSQVIRKILVPFIAASWLLTIWMWYGPAAGNQPMLAPLDGAAWRWAVLIAVLYTIPWALATTGATFNPFVAGVAMLMAPGRKYIIPAMAPIAGALGGILLWSIARLFASWGPISPADSAAGLWHAMSWGTPLVLLTVTLVAVLHIGLMGIRFQEPRREWWSRLGGSILIAALGWMTLFGVGVYGPLLLMWAGGRVATAGFVTWLGTTIGGVLGGRSEKSGATKSSIPLELFLKVAPVIFITGLLLLVSLGVHFTAVELSVPDTSPADIWIRFERPAPTAVCFSCVTGGKTVANPGTPSEQPPPATDAYWRLMNPTAEWWVFAEMLAALGGAFLLAARVDINEFSMNLFYRNRLARCYLAASRSERDFNPYTGYSAKDDLFLATLSNAQFVRDLLEGKDEGQADYAGPYPLANTALNLTTGQKLAWQSRKARSFTFSPRYCGYEVLKDEKVAPNDPNKHRRALENMGYRDTLAYAFSQYYGLAGPLSGTAMGISGAAASPNMGYHSSAPLAFLMTVFNVRLGMWLGNPRHREAWTRNGPQWGLPYLFSELAGQATDERWYVYLSDGGHFENLGIYELVRRRCKCIVASDAGADPEMTFEDLGNAIQKCRIDFGVDIEIDITPLQRRPGTRFSQRHYAVGTVHYERAFEKEEPGVLFYFKASLISDMPADLLHYMEENQAFPHTSTGDQFFDEKQFESYRELGYTAAESAQMELKNVLSKI